MHVKINAFGLQFHLDLQQLWTFDYQSGVATYFRRERIVKIDEGLTKLEPITKWEAFFRHSVVVRDLWKCCAVRLYCFRVCWRYAAGTTPWGNPGSNMANFEPQRHDDGFLEVIGFTTASLVDDHLLRSANVFSFRTWLSVSATTGAQWDILE